MVSLNWKNSFLKKTHGDHFTPKSLSVPGNFYWKNCQGQYVDCNFEVLNVLQLKAEDLIGKTDEELWPEQAEVIKEDDQQVITNKISTIEEQIISLGSEDGKTFLIARMPWLDKQGEVIGTIGSLTDITNKKHKAYSLQNEQSDVTSHSSHFVNMVDALPATAQEIDLPIVETTSQETKAQKAKAQEAKAQEAKATFLENVRYDMRLPLASIMGVSELLSRELNKNEAKKYALGLAETSKELLRLLNETLETTDITSEETPLIKKPFDLKEILENVIKLHYLIALEKGLPVELKFDGNIPKSLIGDPLRIYRIVLELLSNSLKFTKEGYIHVTARVGKFDTQDVIIQIFVEDTGIGISEEKQQELFIRFKQSSLAFQDKFKSNGLGLSVVKELIDDINGEIYVDSYPSKGTKFVCIIPLKKPLLNTPFANVPSTQPSFFAPLAPSTNNQLATNPLKKCVLVVEDYSIASLIAKTLFSEQGCDVDVAENGQMALEQIEQHQYGFILLDIGLPDMDGYEVARKIRMFEKTRGRRRTFIVGLSCHTEEKKKQMALEAGMNIVLTKPLTQEIASSLLENLISSPALAGEAKTR